MADLRDNRMLDYRLVLPPGWVRIPLDDDAEPAIAQIARQAGQRSGNLSVRAIVQSGLRDAVAGARRSEGLHLYMPTELVLGVPVPLSIVVTAPKPTSGSLTDALLSFSARSPSTAVELGGRLGVRQHTDVAAVFDAEGELKIPATRRITYLVVPPTGDRLLGITGSILRFDVPDAEAMTAAVEQLFDAMSESLRFRNEASEARSTA
jgi:hypothetical protein